MALRGGIRRGLKQIASRCMAPAAASVAQPFVMRVPQMSVRLFARPFSQSDSVESKLGELLDREITEEQNLQQGSEVPEGYPEISEKIRQRFTVKESPDNTAVKLYGKYPNNEKILVEFDVTDTTEDEIDADALDENTKPEDYSVGVRGYVTISKGQSKFMFYTVFTNGVWIERMCADTQGRDLEDESLYWTDVNEYPDDVQEALISYLAERGIDADLASFISFYSYEKEKGHYVTGLKEARKFLSS